MILPHSHGGLEKIPGFSKESGEVGKIPMVGWKNALETFLGSSFFF